MNIVLIHPLYRHIYRKIRGVRYLDPPLGLLYIAAALRDNNHAVTVIDAEAENVHDHTAIARAVWTRKPDMVGISFTTPMLGSSADAITSIKKLMPSVPVVIGGPHVTALPADTLKATGADIAVVGEGEETVQELASLLSARKPLNTCAGISLRLNGNIEQTPRRGFIKDLDALPFPARDLLKITLYKHASSLRRRVRPYYTNIISSRGCPFHCIFCGSSAVFGSTIRYRSPIRVVDEINDCMERLNIGIFGFADDTLTVRKSHVLGICEEILLRRIDPLWMAQARVDTVDEETIISMKRAGCRAIHFGYESGSQMILDNINKGITLEQSLTATRIARRAGLKIHGYFMIGNIGETASTVAETIAFAKKLNPDTAQFTIAQPFPGTKFSEIAAREGRAATCFDEYKCYESATYVPPGMSREELLSLHRKAFMSFYFRPRFFLKYLSQLLSPRNWRSIADGVTSLWNISRRG
ncbi:MAG: radical SAM protein [Candidatus Aureabacteria bacterium]|nr:radical SAM protein [Candidatus Auribacterota bacterium]